MVNIFTDFSKEFPMLEYIVKSEQELARLKRAISLVPIGVIDENENGHFDGQLEIENDIPMRTRYVSAEEWIPGGSFLEECVYTQEERDEIMERMIDPYPSIEFATRIMGDHYHEQNLLKQLFFPAPMGRILTPRRVKRSEQETNGIIVLWPAERKQGKRNLQYLELHMQPKRYL